MLVHHLRIALRHFLRNSVYGSLTVAGLAIGIASCLLILLYVQEERAYDRFHEWGDRLYRVDKMVTPGTGGTGRIIAGAGAATLLLALATVSWQAWKAATADPVRSLRCE